ncbi:MAG: TonB-dependent receptor [Gammaproteobacteria bacterium]|nr:TonB-dependent receptor [Gammaproteobacteria bacterium]MDH3431560.1 TonB-dependent receptor [Gammaproteobacteria bacterium]
MNSDKLTRFKQYSCGGTAFLATVLLFSSGTAVAQEDSRSGSAETLLDEITVSARRREERLLDQPMSIAAITGEQMQVQGIYSIDQASKFVPNVTLTNDDRANNTRVVIRGIGGGFPDPVFVFGSGMYVDGHYIPTSLGGYMSTVDIERIELLRGPQGTLFGKNVTGGLVNIISTKPKPEFDSSVTLRLGEDGEQAIRGMVNVPFSDTVFGRFSVASEEFDGYYYNQNLNIDSGFKDTKAARAAIRVQPNANWTVDASLSISRKEDDNTGGQCQNTDRDAPQWGGGTGNLERRLYTGAREDFWAICDADVAAGDFVHSSDKITFSDVDEEIFQLGVVWDSDGPAGQMENATVSFKASYRDMQYNYFADRDYSSWPIDSIGTGSTKGQNNETYGFELLFEGQANDRLHFTAGVNYFDETAFNGSDTCYDLFVGNGASGSVTCVDTGLHFELVPDNPTGADIDPSQDPDLWPNAPRINAGGPGPFGGEVSVWNKSTGIFGHLTYDINDQWTLDVGARWTEDDREFHNFEFASTGCDISVDPRNMCDYTLPVDIDWVNDSGFFNQAADKFSEVTPMLSLTRNLSSGDTLHSGMFYFLYSEGFLTGGFNTEVNANLPSGGPDLSYGPEQVRNYEIGFKGQFMDGNVQIMADVFYMDYTDQQKSFELANPNGIFGSEDPVELVTNIADSSISGFELELRGAFWDGGFVSLDVGYIKNEYDEYTYEDPTSPGTIIDRTDFLINDFTPDMTINLAVEHEFELGGGATITPRLNMNWQDEYEWAAETGDWPKNAPPSGCHQDSFAVFDARVTYKPADGDWQLAAFGGNITDERYIEFCEADRNVWLWRLGRPAWYGIEFSAHFGR